MIPTQLTVDHTLDLYFITIVIMYRPIIKLAQVVHIIKPYMLVRSINATQSNTYHHACS